MRCFPASLGFVCALCALAAELDVESGAPRAPGLRGTTRQPVLVEGPPARDGLLPSNVELFAMSRPRAKCPWHVDGPCTVDTLDCECVTSHRFPYNYGMGESCNMSLHGPDTWYLSVESYDVEEGYDYLTVNGVPYDPSLNGQPVDGNVTWTSDFAVAASGWKMCARRTVTTSTTTTRTFNLGGWYVDGPCEVERGEGKECVMSPGFPSAYGEDLRCEMSIFGGPTRCAEASEHDLRSDRRQ